MKVFLRTYLHDSIHDVVYCVTKKETYSLDSEVVEIETWRLYTEISCNANAYFLYPFLKEVNRSPAYRINFLRYSWASAGYPACNSIIMNFYLRPPDQEIIDYMWNDRILKFVWRHVEIENALFWLSTLGGAFSALGDYFEHCADMAGKISFRQLQLSVKLGDEGLAARSRLYFSLALAQKGKLYLARKVVRSVANFAVVSKDRRLMRMCHGVWAKLRYLRRLKNIAKSTERGIEVSKCEKSKVSSQREPVIV